ncbi:protein of unknown function (plasmid) [Caballeronia sp. S22]
MRRRVARHLIDDHARFLTRREIRVAVDVTSLLSLRDRRRVIEYCALFLNVELRVIIQGYARARGSCDIDLWKPVLGLHDMRPRAGRRDDLRERRRAQDDIAGEQHRGQRELAQCGRAFGITYDGARAARAGRVAVSVGEIRDGDEHMPHTAKDEFVNTLVHAYYVGMNQRLLIRYAMLNSGFISITGPLLSVKRRHEFPK